MKLLRKRETMGETTFTRLFLIPVCIVDFGIDKINKRLFIIDSKKGKLGRFLIFRLYGYFLCFIRPSL